jgi:very-short-patch-repair endonuclease
MRKNTLKRLVCKYIIMSDYIKPNKIIPFEKSFASTYRSNEWSNKNEINPRNVYKSSRKKYIFDCPVCKHEYSASLTNITGGDTGCPYCSNQELCNDANCNLCEQKSFSSHYKSNEWSDKNKITPREVAISSGKKYLFDCKTCKHEYGKSIDTITRYDSGCPFCANQTLCDDMNCISCFQKSFASSNKKNEWSEKNEVSPRNVFISSNKKYIFNCIICKHEYNKTLNNIIKRGCPYCSNKLLCINDNCNLCYEHSFASNENAKYWSKENKVSPRHVAKKSAKKFSFNCFDCKQIYEASLNNVSNGYWCSCTKKKTETKLFDWLILNYNTSVTKQKLFDWCKNERYLPFDFLLENYKIIIELDGRQHFMQVLNWQSPEETQKTDKYKMKQANENNYSVIRISQEDVWNDKNDWQNKLLNSIKKYDKVTNIFIGDIYTNSSFMQ